MAAIKAIVGETVLGKMGEVDVATLCTDETAIGLYFSAHWCPPCRQFTPILKDFYQKMKEEGKKIEVIFVSNDRDEKSFFEYFRDMPWYAMQYNGKRMGIGQKYNVQGIPCLIILGPDGTVWNMNGRQGVTDGSLKDLLAGSTPTK